MGKDSDRAEETYREGEKAYSEVEEEIKKYLEELMEVKAGVGSKEREDGDA